MSCECITEPSLPGSPAAPCDAIWNVAFCSRPNGGCLRIWLSAGQV